MQISSIELLNQIYLIIFFGSTGMLCTASPSNFLYHKFHLIRKSQSFKIRNANSIIIKFSIQTKSNKNIPYQRIKIGRKHAFFPKLPVQLSKNAIRCHTTTASTTTEPQPNTHEPSKRAFVG